MEHRCCVVGHGLVADLAAELLTSSGWWCCRLRADSPAEDESGRDVELVVVTVTGLEDVPVAVEKVQRADRPVLALCDPTSAAKSAALTAAGAASVLTVDTAHRNLVAAANLAAEGFSVLDAAAASAVAGKRQQRREADQSDPPRPQFDLTPREREVIGALAEGVATKSLARQLGVSLRTIENHKASVYKKLGVRTQAQAVAVAVSAGILSGEDS